MFYRHTTTPKQRFHKKRREKIDENKISQYLSATLGNNRKYIKYHHKLKNVLVIGSTGQIGSELTMTLLKQLPSGNIVAGYIPGAEPKGDL